MLCGVRVVVNEACDNGDGTAPSMPQGTGNHTIQWHTVSKIMLSSDSMILQTWQAFQSTTPPYRAWGSKVAVRVSACMHLDQMLTSPCVPLSLVIVCMVGPLRWRRPACCC